MSKSVGILSRIRGKLTSGNSPINAWMMKHPKTTSVMITGFKTIAADLVTQTLIEGTSFKDVDWTRTAVFGSFGFFYMGMFQYWLYNVKFFQWWPGISLKATAWKTAADQLVHTPFIYFPVFYFVRTSINERAVTKETLLSVRQTYKNNVFDDLKRYWTIWTPGIAITFGIMPLHLRLPFIAALSFFWVCILSYYHGQYDHSEMELVSDSENNDDS